MFLSCHTILIHLLQLAPVNHSVMPTSTTNIKLFFGKLTKGDPYLSNPLVCLQALCMDNDSNGCVNPSKKFSHHHPILPPSCYNIALSHLYMLLHGLSIAFNPHDCSQPSFLPKRVHCINFVLSIFLIWGRSYKRCI